MENKGKTIAIIAVIVILGYVGFVVGRSGLFYMKVNERVKNIDRFMTADNVLALPNQIKEDAAHYKVPVEDVRVDLSIDGRLVQSDMLMYYLVVSVTNGSKNFKEEARCESQAQLVFDKDTRARLETAGVKFTGRMPEK